MTFGVLQHRGFRNLWLGQAISQFGDALYYLVILYMADRLTGNPAVVGFVGAAQTAPYLLFGPYAGVVADRLDRRRIMLASDFLSAAVLLGFLALLLLEAKPPVEVIAVIGFCLSTVNVFFAPAKGASIPRLVPESALIEANALSSATQSFMPLIGIALSAIGLGTIERLFPRQFFPTAVGLNLVTFLVSAFFLARLPALIPDRERHETSAWHEAKAGIRFIREHHLLWVVLVTNAIFGLCVAPFMVVYVAVNKLWFDGRYQTLAWFEAAFVAGMVISSLLVGKLKVRRPGRWFIAGSVGLGLAIGLMAWSRNIVLFSFWNLVCGLLIPPISIPLQTYIQLVVLDGMRGRVNAAMAMISQGVQPLGAVTAGWLLTRIGAEWMFILMGGGIVLTGVICILDREFRRVEMPVSSAS